MIKLGLCCQFANEPIKFSTTTATSLLKMKRADALLKLSQLCMLNAQALSQALLFCAKHNIECFRVNSQILPVKTHPQAGYAITDLPDYKEIIKAFEACHVIAKKNKLRTVFHPDQFVLLSSSDSAVTARSLADLDYQAEVSEWIGADVINIHGGGAYGDKVQALKQVELNLKQLPSRVRERLSFENDDKVYTPEDLIPLCEKNHIAFVYDVHHHRCHPDNLSVEEATKHAIATWKGQPLFHISSPKNGWLGPKPLEHHDYIDINDFPECWRNIDATIEVEAKAKELAVIKLYRDLDV